MSNENALPITERANRAPPTGNPQSAPHQAAPGGSSQPAPPAPGQPSATDSSPPLSPQEVTRAVDSIKQLSQQIDRNLQFHIDDSTGKTVVTVLDKETEEVIRQIPSEQLLSVAQRLKEGGGLLEGLTG